MMTSPALPKTFEPFSFTLTLPDGQQVYAHPYRVKEEKVLLASAEYADNQTDQLDAITQVITNCTYGKFDTRTQPYFNTEYAMLMLRARSVSETLTPIYKCEQLKSDETPCGHLTTVTIPLTDIVMTPEVAAPPTIPLDDVYSLTLKWPSIYDAHHIVTAGHRGKVGNGLIHCLGTLTATTGDVIDFANYTEDQRIVWLEALPLSVANQILTFVENIPTVSYTVKYTCEGCGFVHTIPLRGLVDFLD